MSDRKVLVTADKFSIGLAAERDGRIRALGIFADDTGTTLRPGEYLTVRWHEGKVRLAIERQASEPDAVVAAEATATDTSLAVGTPQAA
jgi:hypothetical protein